MVSTNLHQPWHNVVTGLAFYLDILGTNFNFYPKELSPVQEDPVDHLVAPSTLQLLQDELYSRARNVGSLCFF